MFCAFFSCPSHCLSRTSTPVSGPRSSFSSPSCPSLRATDLRGLKGCPTPLLILSPCQPPPPRPQGPSLTKTSGTSSFTSRGRGACPVGSGAHIITVIASQVSPLHHDHWDNILCQIEGKRSFTVFSPFQTAFLYPQGEDMYFSQLDPAAPDLQRFPDFTHATPVHVELEAGDMLFLPAFWWHQVHHAAMRNIAVNFWFYPNEISSAFLKALLQRLNGADPEQGADPEHDG